MDHHLLSVGPEKMILEHLRVCNQLAISDNALLETHRDEALRQLIFRLSDYVLSEKLVGDTKTVNCVTGHSFPSSPWQFFKQRHADSWWLRWLVARRPVRTEIVRQHNVHEVTFERYNTYPQSTLRVRDLGKPVVLESFTESPRIV